ncbi:MAG: hypothetical protein SFW36_20275, partial [Leptolyngbyaceae cyanobacterium bins.59]|nr:hypothetical protein [Leptolyngbyaceae cyanobacterium bins.59]
MYVYIHDRVWQQADEKQCQRLELLTEQIEQGDRLLFGLLFSPRYPYWVKRLRISWRLLAKVITIENEQILCITHLLDRGRREYAEFLKNRQAWGEQHMHLDEGELQTWLAQRQAIQPQLPLPRLPDG